MPEKCLVNYGAAICLRHMQMVKLVLSDSLKCALSHDIHHNLIIGRRHNENLP